MQTPLPPKDYPQAMRTMLQDLEPAGHQTCALSEADGRILAEAIVADRDLPPFDRATMDGYAISSGDFKPGMEWPVSGEIAAGAPAPEHPGQCCRIATGAALPDCFDSVIEHERRPCRS